MKPRLVFVISIFGKYIRIKKGLRKYKVQRGKSKVLDKTYHYFKIINRLEDWRRFGKKNAFDHVSVDAGSSSTIFDTDLSEEMGPLLDLDHDITRKIYGKGATELCMDQNLKNTIIGKFKLTNFRVQLGDVREMHGLNGIIGSDNFKSMIDLNNMELQNS